MEILETRAEAGEGGNREGGGGHEGARGVCTLSPGRGCHYPRMCSFAELTGTPPLTPPTLTTAPPPNSQAVAVAAAVVGVVPVHDPCFYEGRNQISRAPHSSLLMCRVTPCFLSPGGVGGGGSDKLPPLGISPSNLFLFFSSEFSVGAMRVNIRRREDAVYFFGGGGGGGGGPGVVGGCFGRGEQVWGTEFPLFYPVKAQLPAGQQRDWQLVWLVN